jgi:hypothetical protein
MVHLSRRDVLCQCAGGTGAVVSCAGMMLSLAAGLLGVAGGTAAHTGMAGMESMGAASQAHPGTSPLVGVLGFLNRVAVPLLLVSVLLMLLGVARAGRWALGLVALGSALLLGSMGPASLQVQASLLGGGFAFVIAGYAVAWRAAKRRQEVPA